MNRQVREAKQRFSEVLRAVEKDGPQTITRHGQEVAVVVDIAEYRKLTGADPVPGDVLTGPPYFSDEFATIMDEIEAERKQECTAGRSSPATSRTSSTSTSRC